MGDPIKRFKQDEYNRVLDECQARSKGLVQTECERILIQHGASQEQAKNGAYVYIKHNGNAGENKKATKKEFAEILDGIGAEDKKPKDCIQYLEGLGYRYRQSQTAVYNYRRDRGLIGK